MCLFKWQKYLWKGRISTCDIWRSAIGVISPRRRCVHDWPISLKIRSFCSLACKGQMELYLRWLANYEQEADEALPLGIILCAGASTRQVELLELDAAGVHVAEYLTVSPRGRCCSESCTRQSRVRFDSKEDSQQEPEST